MRNAKSDDPHKNENRACYFSTLGLQADWITWSTRRVTHPLQIITARTITSFPKSLTPKRARIHVRVCDVDRIEVDLHLYISLRIFLDESVPTMCQKTKYYLLSIYITYWERKYIYILCIYYIYRKIYSVEKKAGQGPIDYSSVNKSLSFFPTSKYSLQGFPPTSFAHEFLAQFRIDFSLTKIWRYEIFFFQ